MRKKTSLTIVDRAMVLVPEFKSRAEKLEHQVVLRGQSASTLNFITSHNCYQQTRQNDTTTSVLLC